ncbi:MAG: hypothetical protein ABI230_11975, partial [Aestuariivirga sp.]
MRPNFSISNYPEIEPTRFCATIAVAVCTLVNFCVYYGAIGCNLGFDVNKGLRCGNDSRHDAQAQA